MVMGVNSTGNPWHLATGWAWMRVNPYHAAPEAGMASAHWRLKPPMQSQPSVSGPGAGDPRLNALTATPRLGMLAPGCGAAGCRGRGSGEDLS